MAYDVDLADRLREMLVAETGVTEKRMFGGLAFLVDGRMAVVANSQGVLMLRVDPAESPGLLADPRARPMVMRGKELAGWLCIDVDAEVPDEELGRWVDRGVGVARSLPPA